MKNTPLVSVSMICFNAEAFIAQAIEGILSQEVDFNLELVIGDDCSTDQTPNIIRRYAEKHPDLIRVIPGESNLGIGGNTARTMGSCRGKYIAVCDGDDIWTDPLKLKRQVDFLEKKLDYGVVYTDVETIDETGKPVADAEQDLIREMYKQGEVFIALLQANFINNSTALFRRALIDDLNIASDRAYQIPDYIRWLHIATQAKIHFINYKSTQYRKHSRGLSVTVSQQIIYGNRRVLRQALKAIIPKFDACQTSPPNRADRIVLFRRISSLILRGPAGLKQRIQLLRLALKYFPGMTGLIKISWYKAGQLVSVYGSKISSAT